MNRIWFRKRLLILPAAVLVGLMVGKGTAQTAPSNEAAASPEAQAKRIYEAIRDLNFREFYYLLGVSPQARKQFPADPDTFAREMREGFEGGSGDATEAKATRDMLGSIKDIKIGRAVVTGNKAFVPTSARMKVEGHKHLYEGSANLILDEGVWKLDLTFTDDLKVAMSKSTLLLIGSVVSARPS